MFFDYFFDNQENVKRVQKYRSQKNVFKPMCKQMSI